MKARGVPHNLNQTQNDSTELHSIRLITNRYVGSSFTTIKYYVIYEKKSGGLQNTQAASKIQTRKLVEQK